MLGLLAVMTFLVAAAAYTSLLIVQRQAALRVVSRYNLTWLASQASLEVSRLQGTIGAALAPGSDVDRDDVELRLEIVENRVQLLGGGEVADFVSKSPELSAIVANFRAVAVAARLELDGPPNRERMLNLLKLVDGLQPSLARLAAKANAWGGELVAEDQRHLGALHWTFAGILGALTLCGFGLVGAMTWHNRLLALAQDEVAQQNRNLQLRDIELNIQNARFDAALTNMSHALCMIDAEQHMIICNLRFYEVFGLKKDQASPGTPARDVFAAIAASGRYSAVMLETVFLRQFEQAKSSNSAKFVEEDNTGKALAIAQEPMTGGGWVATFEDITERRRAEARISYMAHHDALTDLPNR